MSIQLSLAAFFATFFPMLLVGIGLGVWAARRKRKAPKWEQTSWYVDPEPSVANDTSDTRATLDGSVKIQELLEKCKRKEI